MKFLNIICRLKKYFLDFYFTKFSFIYFVCITNNMNSMKIQYYQRTLYSVSHENLLNTLHLQQYNSLLYS